LNNLNKNEAVSQGRPALNRLTVWASLNFVAILGFTRIAYGLLMPDIRADLAGTSYGWLGLVGTLNFVGYLAGTLSLPPILKRTGSPVLVNALALTGVSLTMVGTATSQDLLQLGFWRLVTGILAAYATILILSLTLAEIQPTQRGRASGLVWLGGSIGVLLVGLFLPLVIGSKTTGSWRWSWLVMAALGLVAAWGFYRVKGTKARPVISTAGENRWKSVWGLLLSPQQFGWATAGYFMFGAGYIIYFTFFTALVVQQGVPPLQIGLIWAVAGIGGMSSGFLWGRALDRWPSGWTVGLALLTGGLAVLTVWTGNVALELMGALVVGLCAFTAPPAMMTTLLRLRSTEQTYTTALSLLTAVFATGQIAGPLVGSLVVENFGLIPGVTLAAAFLILGGLLTCAYGFVVKRVSE
jgi:predicted MFS family arabinose efflux permease